MDHIIEGVIVNPEIHESKQIQGDYVDGKFIDTETYNRIFNESVELGAKVAETVYTPEGRDKNEKIIDQIKINLRRNIFLPIPHKSQILWAIEKEDCNNLSRDEKGYLNRLNRALRYIRHKQTSLVDIKEGFERDILKISAQSNGFKQGFNNFYNSSQYKDEDEKNKPWYLKHDDNNLFLK